MNQSYGVMGEIIACIWMDDWDRPTHLEGYAISGLVEHLLSAIEQFSQLAAGEAFDGTTVVDVTAANVAVTFDEVAARSLAEWGKPTALTDRYAMPWGDEVGERLAAYLIIEVAGHGWDLSTALGIDMPMADDLASPVLEVARSFSEETLRAPGMFGPQQQTSGEAVPLHQLMSFLGRKVS